MLSMHVACLALTRKTGTYREPVFDVAWSCQRHWIGHGQHPTFKMGMMMVENELCMFPIQRQKDDGVSTESFCVDNSIKYIDSYDHKRFSTTTIVISSLRYYATQELWQGIDTRVSLFQMIQSPVYSTVVIAANCWAISQYVTQFGSLVSESHRFETRYNWWKFVFSTTACCRVE